MRLTVLLYLFAVCAFICLVQGYQVPVTVYYESLCPDSKKFFNSQLYPTLTTVNISHLINLTLVPYGLSKTKLVDTSYQFECHHGPFECQGNEYHACALEEIEKIAPRSAGEGYNNISVAFVNCLMDHAENKSKPKLPDYDFHVEECAKTNNVPQYMNIVNCLGSSSGPELLAKMGDLTDKLQPKLKSVPTIVFNNTFKKEDTDMAQSNFLKVLCGYIPTDKPDKCKGSAASITLSVLAFALVLLHQLF